LFLDKTPIFRRNCRKSQKNYDHNINPGPGGAELAGAVSYPGQPEREGIVPGADLMNLSLGRNRK
jgi:hypothetical protein